MTTPSHCLARTPGALTHARTAPDIANISTGTSTSLCWLSTTPLMMATAIGILLAWQASDITEGRIFTDPSRQSLHNPLLSTPRIYGILDVEAKRIGMNQVAVKPLNVDLKEPPKEPSTKKFDQTQEINESDQTQQLKVNKLQQTQRLESSPSLPSSSEINKFDQNQELVRQFADMHLCDSNQSPDQIIQIPQGTVDISGTEGADQNWVHNEEILGYEKSSRSNLFRRKKGQKKEYQWSFYGRVKSRRGELHQKKENQRSRLFYDAGEKHMQSTSKNIGIKKPQYYHNTTVKKLERRYLDEMKSLNVRGSKEHATSARDFVVPRRYTERLNDDILLAQEDEVFLEGAPKVILEVKRILEKAVEAQTLFTEYIRFRRQARNADSGKKPDFEEVKEQMEKAKRVQDILNNVDIEDVTSAWNASLAKLDPKPVRPTSTVSFSVTQGRMQEKPALIQPGAIQASGSHSPDDRRLIQTAKEVAAIMVANRLGQADQGLRNRLTDTLSSLNLSVNRRSTTPITSRSKIGSKIDSGCKGSEQAKSKGTKARQIRSKSHVSSSLLPSSWGFGVSSGWKEGGDKSSGIGVPVSSDLGGQSKNQEDIQFLLLKNTQLEGLLRAVDAALQKSPFLSMVMEKDQVAKLRPSYERPANIHAVADMVLSELERINEGLKKFFGYTIDDLLQGK